MNKYFTFLILFFSFKTFAGGELQAVGARQAGMGNASVGLSDVFATNYNQAGLGYLSTISIGASTELRYTQLGIYNSQISVAIPIKKAGTFAYAANFFGDKNYNEIRTGLAYGKAFGKKFAVGLRVDYMRVGIVSLANKNALSFDVGVQYKIFDNLVAGAHISNPSRFKIDGEKYKERFATIMQVGLAYTAYKKVTIAAEFEKDLDFKPNFKFGVEYHPVSILFLRAGFNTQPLAVTFGAGIETKNGFVIDVASAYQARLGFSPHLSLKYNIHKKSEAK
jgi:hypothetical protein